MSTMTRPRSSGGTGGGTAVSGLWAFGRNDWGQLGHPDTGGGLDGNPTPTLVSLPGATAKVVEVAPGAYHSLVVTATGQLYGFGDNLFGQLGEGVAVEPPVPHPTPVPISLPDATGPVMRIAAGSWFSLALTTTGQLYAFGVNRAGQLGRATSNNTDDANPTPSLVSLPGAAGTAARIAAGNWHSLVVTSTGQLYAFGSNDYGQLGNSGNAGTELPNPTPTLVNLPGATGPVIRIAAGALHSLALTSTGQLYAFGANNSGQLGLLTTAGSEDPNPTPTLVVLPGAQGQVVEIAAGWSHSLAVTSHGELYAFGCNTNGELGNQVNYGTDTANPTPALVALPGATDRPLQVAGGMRHSFALTRSGQLFGFGSNWNGQLGDAFGSVNLTTPARLALPGNPTLEVVGGGAWALHTLVVVSNLGITTPSLPAGMRGVAYTAQLGASGGIAPYEWSAVGLPSGLMLDAAGGTIAGAPVSDGDFQVEIRVVDSRGIAASKTFNLVVEAQTGTVVPVHPAGGALPSISGNTTEGETLTVLHGAWLNQPTSYSYQWQRCDATGAACSPIAGATGPTYALTAADVGHTIRVSESASNAAGTSAPLNSLPTGVVRPRSAADAPSNSIPPTITGNAVIGAVLTASPGAWSGTPPLSYGFQWQRRKPDWQDIAGATGQAYTIASSNLGRRLRVVVTAVNAYGDASAASPETGDVRANFKWPRIRNYLWMHMWPFAPEAAIEPVLRDGGYRYDVAAPSAGVLEISWYQGRVGAEPGGPETGLLVATGKRSFSGHGRAGITVELTAAGEELLSKNPSQELTAVGTFTARGKRKLTTTRRFALSP